LKTLKEAERKNNSVIQENELQEMMDYVYPDWDKESRENYDAICTLFSKSVNDLIPMHYDERNEEFFYNQFDGIKVLPNKLIEEYQKYLSDYQFVKADSLTISITKSRFVALKTEGKISSMNFAFEDAKSKVKYRNAYVVNLKYDDELGLLFKEEDNSSYGNLI